MLLVRGLIEQAPTEEVLLTGAGDGVVKLWRLDQAKDNAVPSQIAKLQNGDPVLSIAVEGSFLYCGLAGGALNIWNLDSYQLVKRISMHTGDLWAVDIIHGVAVCGDSNGVIKVGALSRDLDIRYSLVCRSSIPGSRKSVAGWPTEAPCWHPQPVASKIGTSTPVEEMITLSVYGI